MRTDTVDVCIIEDDVAERALLFRRLLDAEYSVVEAEDAVTGLAQIQSHRPRVVICDLMLPGMNGMELCRHVRADQSLSGTYFILVSAHDARDTRNTALGTGADDFLGKPYDYEELSARLRNGLRVSKLQECLRQAALTDGLTSLWNHTQFRELLDREFARTRRYGGVAALLMLDIDHFKAVNDTYGHETGNRVLKALADHLQETVRDTDIVARYGGEEFAVICPAINLDDATQMAERIRQTLPDRVRLAQCPNLEVTASIGVSVTTDPRATSVHDLIDLADRALYTGKHAGRNRVVRCDEVADSSATTGIQHTEVNRLQKQVVSLSMQAKELCLQSVWALVQALDARDPQTAWHSRNTTFYATSLAEAADLPPALCTAIANAAMLHDLGKIGVPDRILQTRDPLAKDEAAVLRQVPLLTCKILEPLRVFETEILIIRHLRERYDGTGYPAALAGTGIPVGSRLLAVAEAFEAITSDRPHRARRTTGEAIQAMRAEAGQQFDPQFVELLNRVLAEHGGRWAARIQMSQHELDNPQSSSPD